MCGRFTLQTPAEQLAAYFLAASFDVAIPHLKPRFNIAPTQMVATIRFNESREPEFAPMRWGLIPSWAKDTKIGYQLINARGETLSEKPSFRSAFKRRRCLILADGFYEWLTEGKQKRPFYIYRPEHQPICFAGLWEYWEDSEAVIESTTIVTTSANDSLRDLHDRMPVVIPTAAFDMWLDPTIGSESVEQQALKNLLQPMGNDYFVRHEVASGVNSSKSDLPDYIQKIPNDRLFDFNE